MTLAGLRPGEKLFEEKLMAEEGLKKTKNKLIHIGCPIPFNTEQFENVVEANHIGLDVCIWISDEATINLVEAYLDGELEVFGQKYEEIPFAHKDAIQWFASKQANAHDVFFVGRGIDYAICMEGSLKMKEISYIHSEAYAAGELKHGTISLIEDDILVVGVLTQPDLYEKTISNMVECRSRGAYLMGLTTFGQYNIEDSTDFAVYIPKIDPHFATSLAVIPLQLLGYYISVAKGLDVDKPRNLAKSVTVE